MRGFGSMLLGLLVRVISIELYRRSLYWRRYSGGGFESGRRVLYFGSCSCFIWILLFRSGVIDMRIVVFGIF